MSLSLHAVSPAERRRARELDELLSGLRPADGHELAPLVHLVAALRPASPDDLAPAPRAEFRAALRAQLVSEAASRGPSAVPAQRKAPEHDAPPRHRVRRLVAAGAALTMVTGIGAAAASSRALPGDALYGLKRGIESAQLHLAQSDLGRGRELLEQADHRLAEAEAMAASEDARSPQTRARIAQTIADLTRAAGAGATELEASYRETGSAEPLEDLQRFVAEQQERLADLAALLDPQTRELLGPARDLLATWQDRVSALLAGDPITTTAAAASPLGAGAAPEAARSSGDGWALSRVLTAQGQSAAQAGAGGTGGSGAQAGGGVADAVAGAVQGAVDALPGAGAGGSGGGGSGGAGSGIGVASAAGQLPVPRVSVPQVSVPPVTPAPVVSAVPLPTVPVPSVSVPSVPAPSVPVPTVAVCIPLPPNPHC